MLPFFRAKRASKSAESHRASRNRLRLEVEVLEDRLSPAIYIWAAQVPGADLWSDGSNWVDDAGNRYRVDQPPTSADTLRFTDRSLQSSMNDRLTQVARLEVTSAYTSRIIISLSPIVPVLVVNGGYMENGELAGPRVVINSSVNNPFEWRGGTISADVTIRQDAKLTICPPPIRSAHLDHAKLENFGIISFTSGVLNFRESQLYNYYIFEASEAV